MPEHHNAADDAIPPDTVEDGSESEEERRTPTPLGWELQQYFDDGRNEVCDDGQERALAQQPERPGTLVLYPEHRNETDLLTCFSAYGSPEEGVAADSTRPLDWFVGQNLFPLQLF